MSIAPPFVVGRGSAPLAVESTYRGWADHYNACTTCQRDDWYGPLAGEPLFCVVGRELFRAWVRVTHINPIKA